MRNLEIPANFLQLGGTEYAPLSTSADVDVALGYSNLAEERLIFKVVTSSFMERGADLQYLSAFPQEAECLYPPLTYLQPTGLQERIDTNQSISFTVVEVRPMM